MKYFVYGMTVEREYLVLRVENPKSIGLVFMKFSDMVDEGGTIECIDFGPHMSGGRIKSLGSSSVTKGVMYSNLTLLESHLTLLPKKLYPTLNVSFDKNSQEAEVTFKITSSEYTYSYVEDLVERGPISLDEVTESMCDLAFSTCEDLEITERVDMSEWFDEFGECIYDI